MNMVEIAGKCLITIGIIFDLFGCIGLVRLPDLYNRLQAATKCVTLGTCSILIGNLVIAGFNAIGIKALLCAILARASYIAGVKLWEGSIIDKLKEDIEAGKKE